MFSGRASLSRLKQLCLTEKEPKSFYNTFSFLRKKKTCAKRKKLDDTEKLIYTYYPLKAHCFINLVKLREQGGKEESGRKKRKKKTRAKFLVKVFSLPKVKKVLGGECEKNDTKDKKG